MGRRGFSGSSRPLCRREIFFSAPARPKLKLLPRSTVPLDRIGLIRAGLSTAVYAAWAGGRNLIRRPIESLLGGTAEWRKGNYAARGHLTDRSSEIGRLGAAFNEMAEALAAPHAAQQSAEEGLRDLDRPSNALSRPHGVPARSCSGSSTASSTSQARGRQGRNRAQRVRSADRCGGGDGAIQRLAYGKGPELACFVPRRSCVEVGERQSGGIVLSTHCKELEALSKSGRVTDAAQLVKVIREDYRTVEARRSDRLPRVA